MIINLKNLRKKLKRPGGLKNHLKGMREGSLYDVIMFIAPQRIKDLAGKVLLKRKDISVISLANIIRYCSEPMGKEALERLLKEDPSEETLSAIFKTKKVSELIKEKVREELKNRYPEKKKKGY